MPIPSLQRWMVCAVALGIPLSGIGAQYPGNTWLQVGPVALLIPVAILSLRGYPLSNASAACIAAFVLLHLFAARWSYSFVPYSAWLPQVDAWFGFERNMFDRLVHFLFGLLAILPYAEVARRYRGAIPREALAGAVMFVFAVGGLYEIFEWTLTLLLAPGDAGAYNGEQGDIFDGQKDMAIAASGALIAAIPVHWHFKRIGSRTMID